jgi:hypothetical protein
MKSIPIVLAALNGWQRAWFVLAAVGFVGVVICAIYSFPTLERLQAKVTDEKSSMLYEGNTAMQDCFKLLQSDNAEVFPLCSRLAIENRKNWTNFVETYATDQMEKINVTSSRTQALWVVTVIGTWAGTLTVLYIFGVIVAWIRRGSQPLDSQNK